MMKWHFSQLSVRFFSAQCWRTSLDGEGIDWMNLHRWKKSSMKISKNHSTMSENKLIMQRWNVVGALHKLKGISDRQKSQMDMSTSSSLDPRELWEFDSTPSIHSRNNNTRGQLIVLAFDQQKEEGNVLMSGCIQFPINNVNSNLYGESSLDQLFVLIFHYGKPGFLRNRVERTDLLAIRNGIDYPIV